MSNYKIEGGINFFAELYKSLDVEESKYKTEEDTNKCLISNQPLIDKFVQLSCGHKFNYMPLFLDIKNHKQKFNGLESSSYRLHQDEIRCPYCRIKQKGVLPYYEELGLEKLHGVNYIDPTLNTFNTFGMYYKKCQFITPNPTFDPSGNNIVETDKTNSGNCKFLKCFVMGSQINYYNGIVEGLNYGDENYYCWSHKKMVIKKYKKDIADKKRAEIKEAKLKEKEEAKLAKQKAKEDAKEEKRKAKEDAKSQKPQKTKKVKVTEENVVLGPSIVVNDDIHNDDENKYNINNHENIGGGCLEILKSGPNKGNPCGCKVISDNMCKRHSKISK